VGTLACGADQPAPGGAASTPAPAGGGAAAPAAPSTPGGDTTKLAPTILEEKDGPDDSRVTVKQMNGRDKVEVRTWASGPVEKVTRFTNAQKTKVVRVKLREGGRYRVDDPETVEHALEWPAAQLADAAKRLGKQTGGNAPDEADGDEKAASDAQ
jgi:hypothetical protein